MENMLDKALKVARSDTVKASGKTLFKDIIGILMYDPNAAWSMLEDVKKLSSTIRDGIFFECLETYILYLLPRFHLNQMRSSGNRYFLSNNYIA